MTAANVGKADPSSLSTTISQDIKKIVNELLGHDDGVEFGDGYHDECKKEAEQATQSLLAAFEKHLPEKIKDTSAQDLRAGTFTRGQDKYTEGYNQAITDITQLIKENKEKL